MGVHVQLGQEVLSREYKRHQETQALHGFLLSPKKVGSARLLKKEWAFLINICQTVTESIKLNTTLVTFIIRLCLKKAIGKPWRPKTTPTMAMTQMNIRRMGRKIINCKNRLMTPIMGPNSLMLQHLWVQQDLQDHYFEVKKWHCVNFSFNPKLPMPVSQNWVS